MDCSFCGKEISSGKDRIYVNKKGKAWYFCSMKCEKNLVKLGRDPRKLKWTKFYERGAAPKPAAADREEKKGEGAQKAKSGEKPKKARKEQSSPKRAQKKPGNKDQGTAATSARKKPQKKKSTTKKS